MVALAVCGAALASTPAWAGYSFETINDPADPPFPAPPATGGVTFTNLMGIDSSGNFIAGFYGSGQAGDPNTGFLLTLPGKTFSPDNFPAMPQTQITALKMSIGMRTGYTYPTNTGVATDFQFGFYEKGRGVHHGQQPGDPRLRYAGRRDPGVITENQLIGVNNAKFRGSLDNDSHGDSHGYTYDIATETFSADINDPLAVSTVTAAINNSDEIAGFFTDASGVIHGFIDNGGAFTTVDPAGSTETQLLGLNDEGIADGFAVIDGVQHGIIYDSLTKTFAILDPAGSTATTLNGINDAAMWSDSLSTPPATLMAPLGPPCRSPRRGS